jgi:hypothetical protein
MDQFTRYVSFALLRDASFVTVAAITLMVAFSFDPPLALKIAAFIALGFALLLLLRALLMTENAVVTTEPWRGLEPQDRPEGDQGKAWACARMEETLLRFAKTASGLACALFCSSLLVAMM